MSEGVQVMPRECERSTSVVFVLPKCANSQSLFEERFWRGATIQKDNSAQSGTNCASSEIHLETPVCSMSKLHSLVLAPCFAVPHLASSCFTSGQCRSSSKSTCLRSLKRRAFLCTAVTYKWQRCRCDLPNTFPATSDNCVQPFFAFCCTQVAIPGCTPPPVRVD